MTTVIYILCLLLLIQLAIICFLYENVNRNNSLLHKIKEKQELVQKHIYFANDTHEMVLWKIRYDIFLWKDQFVKKENYEMAEQTKAAINIIDGMIQYYRDNLKQLPNETKNH